MAALVHYLLTWLASFLLSAFYVIFSLAFLARRPFWEVFFCGRMVKIVTSHNSCSSHQFCQDLEHTSKARKSSSTVRLVYLVVLLFLDNNVCFFTFIYFFLFTFCKNSSRQRKGISTIIFMLHGKCSICTDKIAPKSPHKWFLLEPSYYRVR